MPLLSRRGIFLFSDKIERFSDKIENKKMTSIWKKGIVGLPHHDRWSFPIKSRQNTKRFLSIALVWRIIHIFEPKYCEITINHLFCMKKILFLPAVFALLLTVLSMLFIRRVGNLYGERISMGRRLTRRCGRASGKEHRTGMT